MLKPGISGLQMWPGSGIAILKSHCKQNNKNLKMNKWRNTKIKKNNSVAKNFVNNIITDILIILHHE